ncbi:DNA-directed RNA polymerase subunit E'' [Candidatus Woesearchaeota archaeon]|nr:DNA-directed RNA polymerase subunit E'' [Candidatus Woesearchaeota archaeon]
MAKDKVCKNCKIFVEGTNCPLCKGNQFTNVYQGRLTILDANKSFVAQQMGIKEKGRYAIKIR